MARKAGLSIPTIRLLEEGRGNLRSWKKSLSALAYELKGRNLPQAETLEKQIATLRRRHSLGQRALCAAVGITQPTLIRLERAGQGRLDVLDRVLTVLGAGPVLLPRGKTPAFFTHAGNSSAHHGWETPRELLQILYSVFGRFDLDPCSPTDNHRAASVRARVYYTASDDGLNLPWHGKVFLNPPYGRAIGDWTALKQNPRSKTQTPRLSRPFFRSELIRVGGTRTSQAPLPSFSFVGGLASGGKGSPRRFHRRLLFGESSPTRSTPSKRLCLAHGNPPGRPRQSQRNWRLCENASPPGGFREKTRYNTVRSVAKR